MSAITFAASLTSIGVRSSPPVTANMMFFAQSRFVSRRGFSIALLAASTALVSPSAYPIPKSAVPDQDIVTLMSAKSMLIIPGLTIRSVIPCTQSINILSIILNACLKVVFLSTTLKILSFGTMIKVSTDCFIFINPSVAFASLFLPSKLKGLVITHTVKIPISLAICAITGAAPVPVPPPIHAVMKTISVS
jgi:hypothetical protein